MIDGAKFAQENECLFSEGSAKTGEGIDAAFSKLTQTVIYKIDSGEIPEDSLSTSRRAGQTGGVQSSNFMLPPNGAETSQ